MVATARKVAQSSQPHRNKTAARHAAAQTRYAPASKWLRHEELDLYRGRGSDDYTDGEVEQWRDVLMTLQPHEVLPWGQSVKRRGLVMPAAIHEEFMLLASDTQ